MWSDPIVDEVHRIRKQLLANAKGDLRKVIDGAARRQKRSGRVVLEATPRTPAGALLKASGGKTKAT